MRRTRKVNALLAAIESRSDLFKSPLVKEFYTFAVEKALDGEGAYLEFIQSLEQFPMSIEEFLDSPECLAATDLSLWPEVRNSIIQLNKNWWKGIDYNNFGEQYDAAYKEVILAGATGCVDADTEYLSPTGWKRIADYRAGDRVLQFEENGEAEFVHPLEFIKLPCSWMYHFSAPGSIDQMLTPEHHVVFYNDKGEIDVCTAQTAADIHNKVGFSGVVRTTFDFPQQADQRRASFIAMKILTGHPDCTMVHRGVWDITIKSQPMMHTLKWILGKSEIDFSETCNRDRSATYRFSSRELQVTNLFDHLDVAKEAAMIVDPLMTTPLKTGGMYYLFSDKVAADFFQFGSSVSGERAYVADVGEGLWEVKAGLAGYVTLRSRSSKREYKQVDKVDTTDGFKYCFSVPSSMLILRRKGYVFITGNTGKTEITKVTMAYHLHILGCMKNPQKYWGLPSATSIVFPIQAAKPHVVKRLIYLPLRKMIEAMPWFKKHLRHDKSIESEMFFPSKNIRIFMGNADDDAILGEAVIGCAVDEINFMVIVENSKKAAVGGRSGVFNQARQIYTALSSRKKGRFTRANSPMVGILCISSSTKYKGDFTDKRIDEVMKEEEAGVYIYRRAQYEVRPKERYSGNTFRVLVANEVVGQSRLVPDGETPPEGARILHVPTEYRDDFVKDLYRALRDYCGIADKSITPFIRNRDKIMEAVRKFRTERNQPILEKDVVELATEGMPRVRAGIKCHDRKNPRYIHIDLSINGDPCGVSMVRHDGMVHLRREDGTTETLPKATVEFSATIKPSESAEIDIAEVRSWAQQFRTQYGFPVKAITYDQYQSVESRQQLRKQGIPTGRVSVDDSLQPYEDFKTALYDGRITLNENSMLVNELFELELNTARGKIDHPPDGTKDTADSACGAYRTLLTRTRTWVGSSDVEVEDGEVRPSAGRESRERMSSQRRSVERPSRSRR